jgi:hypothetical protein
VRLKAICGVSLPRRPKNLASNLAILCLNMKCEHLRIS